MRHATLGIWLLTIRDHMRPRLGSLRRQLEIVALELLSCVLGRRRVRRAGPPRSWWPLPLRRLPTRRAARGWVALVPIVAVLLTFAAGANVLQRASARVRAAGLPPMAGTAAEPTPPAELDPS